MTTLLQRILALGLLALAAFWLNGFPFARTALIFGAIGYAALLYWRPVLALLLLPALLPLLQLAPWSGRLYVDEFDVLVVITLAAALWQGRYSLPLGTLPSSQRIVLVLFLMVYAAALAKGVLPWPHLDANANANYYSELNGLRVAKGLFWALLLYPLWVVESAADRVRARDMFTKGLVLGATTVLLVVLWERGVFQALVFWTDQSAPIRALLDFSTKYRVTALFADMHTGGTAIDGYLMLTLPLLAAASFHARNKAEITIMALVSFGILYAAVVTFSRGLYLGVGVAVAAAAFLLIRTRQREASPAALFGIAASLVALSALSFVSFRSGGTLALMYTLLAFLAGAAAALLRDAVTPRGLVVGASVAVLLLATFSTASISARSDAFEPLPAWLIAAVTVACGLVAGAHATWRLNRSLNARQVGATLMAVVALGALLTPSLLGFRMEARFDTVKEDLFHRLTHWRTAIELVDEDWPTRLFGQGLGRFPETYYWQHQNARDVGGFRFDREDGNQFVRFFGAQDVRLGQRLWLQPNRRYTLSLDVRTQDPKALLYLRICHRHLIHPTERNPTCLQFGKSIRSTGKAWQHREFRFDSGNVGSWKNTLKAPLVFTFANRREYAFNLIPQTVLDIDNLSLRNAAGEELLANGDFEAGIDRWFAYYDFNHLPWHIKNLWVHMYFETGLIGLALFLLLLVGALRQAARNAAHDWLAGALFVSLISFLAVGSFGTLIDAPRIALLFYLLILMASGIEASRVSAS